MKIECWFMFYLTLSDVSKTTAHKMVEKNDRIKKCNVHILARNMNTLQVEYFAVFYAFYSLITIFDAFNNLNTSVKTCFPCIDGLLFKLYLSKIGNNLVGNISNFQLFVEVSSCNELYISIQCIDN